MYSLTLGELVKKALLHSGCDPSVIHELDHHATVQLDIKHQPSMYVGYREEKVVVWTDLCEFSVALVERHSEALLKEIMKGFPLGDAEQIVLRESGGMLQAYVQLLPACLDTPEHLSAAFDLFFDAQCRLLEIVSR